LCRKLIGFLVMADVEKNNKRIHKLQVAVLVYRYGVGVARRGAKDMDMCWEVEEGRRGQEGVGDDEPCLWVTLESNWDAQDIYLFPFSVSKLSATEKDQI
jgi:hypothetical protein